MAVPLEQPAGEHKALRKQLKKLKKVASTGQLDEAVAAQLKELNRASAGQIEELNLQLSKSKSDLHQLTLKEELKNISLIID